MKKIALCQLTVASILSLLGLAMAGGAAMAQQTTPKSVPTPGSITISGSPSKNYRIVLSASHLGQAFIVSASMPVPYSDLNLARDPDAAELGRRIHVAAHLDAPAQF